MYVVSSSFTSNALNSPRLPSSSSRSSHTSAFCLLAPHHNTTTILNTTMIHSLMHHHIGQNVERSMRSHIRPLPHVPRPHLSASSAAASSSIEAKAWGCAHIMQHPSSSNHQVTPYAAKTHRSLLPLPKSRRCISATTAAPTCSPRALSSAASALLCSLNAISRPALASTTCCGCVILAPCLS